MRPPASFRASLVVFLLLGLALHPARALVTLNDGTDKIFVTGTFAMGFDSNISASAAATGDVTYSSSFSLEYQRRAGIITVNANVNASLNDFVKNPSYDTLNPSYSLELDKGTGRLTGALTLTAARQSQADAAVNLYTTAWNYGLGLNLHYPVIERYSFTLSLNYGLLDYTETSGQPLVNLSTYSATLGFFYILSDERDLFLSYRYRFEQSSDSTNTTDEGLSLGVNGRIIWEINGSLSVGYGVRTPHGVADDGVVDSGTYNDLWLTGSTSYALNRRTTFNASISRDFATTATNATTDTTSAALEGVFAANARFSVNAGVGGGINQFLGPFGYLPGTTTDRRDYYFTWHAGTTYIFNSHLSVSLAYNHFQNWSNLSFATFARNSYSLSLSSRW